MPQVIYCDSNGDPIDHFTQWDVNQKLVVKGADTSSAPEFHFSNCFSKAALVVQSVVSEDIISANIPNVLLQQALPLIVHMYYFTTLSMFFQLIIRLLLNFYKKIKNPT
jgi:hypothetical protein